MSAAAVAAPAATQAGWRPLLVAMAKSGSGALTSGLLTALANKILAATAGPAALAVLATLQHTRQAALIVATGNGQTALIQGACALAGRERREFMRTVAVWFMAVTAMAAAALWMAPPALARWTGLPAGSERLLRWMGVPLAASVVFLFAGALLSALGQVGRLAAAQCTAALVMACGAWPAAQAARAGHPESLVWLLSSAAGASALLAVSVLWPFRHVFRPWWRGAGRWWSAAALGHFMSISGALLATGCLAALSVVHVRSRILATQGLETTGQFDAAWAISMNQVTLVLASVQSYALPTLTKARDGRARADELARLLTVAPLCAALAIVFLAASKLPLLSLLYSGAFHPAAAYLRWTLLGDYLKVTSWILSLAMLAAANTRAFVLADVAAYGVFSGAAWALARWVGAAEGAAIAFVLMYAVHASICGGYVWRTQGLRIRSFAAAWITGLVGVAGVTALTWGAP